MPDAEVRAAEYAQRKQSMVLRLIETGKFTPYPDALRFVLDAKGRGILVAAASSSKNAQLLLRQIRIDTFVQEGGLSSPLVRPGLTLRDLFDADVSGHEFDYGKPHPEMFLAAAREARRLAEALHRVGGCPGRCPGGQGRGHGSDRARPRRRRRPAPGGRGRHGGRLARRGRPRRIG